MTLEGEEDVFVGGFQFAGLFIVAFGIFFSYFVKLDMALCADAFSTDATNNSSSLRSLLTILIGALRYVLALKHRDPLRLLWL